MSEEVKMAAEQEAQTEPAGCVRRAGRTGQTATFGANDK